MNRLRTRYNFLVEPSVTRCQIYFLFLWLFTTKTLAQKHTKVAKVLSKLRQILNKPSKYCQISLIFGQNGKIAPNLVALVEPPKMIPPPKKNAAFLPLGFLNILVKLAASKSKLDRQSRDLKLQGKNSLLIICTIN